MTPEQTVDAFIAAIQAKDITAAVGLAAENISYENVPIAPVVGREGLAQMLESFLGPTSAVEWRILGQWCVERTVINERLDRFQIGGRWVELPVAGFFRIDDEGYIALWRDYFDLDTYTRQINDLTPL